MRLSSVLVTGGLLVLALPEVAHASTFTSTFNHPNLEWHTLETEHFYIHWSKSRHPETAKRPLDDTFMAERTAKVAEEMWKPMCEQFDYYLKEKIHIVLLDQSDDLEGFTIPAWNWIEISGNPGGYFYRMRGRMEWFSDVLVHEFAHVVSLKRNAALAEGTGQVNIGGLYNNGINNTESGFEIGYSDATSPFWWQEGGAEYWSDTAGYNIWTPARDANIRTTFLEDRVLTYDEWITRQDKSDWGDGERGYQQGYAFGLYLRERFGHEAYSKMSIASGKRWRANWETIIEEVTGVPLRQLYDDWVAYEHDRYNKQYAAVKAEGEAVGAELEVETGDWVVRDPDARDKWMEQEKTKHKRRKQAARERKKEATGTWDFYPRYSDDGKWIGEDASGQYSVGQLPEEVLPGIAGQDPGAPVSDIMRHFSDTGWSSDQPGSAFGHGFDFVPGKDAMVISGTEEMWARTIPGIFQWETDGYDFGNLWTIDLSPNPKLEKRKHHGAKEEYESLHTVMAGPTHRNDYWRYHPIPNTLHAADPAVSPDGTKIAYFEYRDGTNNLVVINMDGTGKTYITDFKDGTWGQNADWSPDGTQLVWSMIRNFRQDLYVASSAGGGEITALNRDRHEDQDALWGKDGNIYFSSDATGIFNIFRYEPATGKVSQLTNVIGGAECPWITPEGNLLYTNLTGHGWKNFVLARDEFLEKDVTSLFDFTPDAAEVKADLAYSEDLSSFMEHDRKYHGATGEWMSPTAVPMLRFENDSLTNFGLSAGGQIYAQDFVENHNFFTQVFLGEDPLFLAGYTFNGWYPSISILGYHYEAKYDYGFKLDADQDPSTLGDQKIFEGKQNQYVNIGRVDISYPFNGHLSTEVFGGGFDFGFRGTSDTGFQPYLRGLNAGVALHWNSIWASYNSPNPRGGRAIDLSWEHGHTDIVYAPYNGFDVDDGQILDEYPYNRIQARWTEHLRVPNFWIPALKTLANHRHALTFDGQVGMMDRNVSYQDEFRGGGTHPYYVGNGALQPNNQFSGYPGYSLSGETMIVLAGAYRFPVMRQINKKIGPLYIFDMTAQLGGTTGNFWSYEIDKNAPYYYDSFGQKVAVHSEDVHREIPFFDRAYKNGNYLLWDANAELRISSTLMGEASWNTFVRAAYGFNRIKGVGDVNGDDIQDTSDNGLGDSLSNETEPPGLRLYVGLGTGW